MPRRPARDQHPDDPARESARQPAPAPAPSAAATILQLQRSAGNQAVAMLLRDPDPAAAATPAADAPADPGTAQLEADWNAASEQERNRFKGEGRPPGDPHTRYLKLAKMYKAEKGIERPILWVRDNIVDGQFFEAKSPMHKDLQAALSAAESELKTKHGVTEQPFKGAWAFNPRTTTRGGWSNHAEGKAIDIDAASNPHLLEMREKKVINALTGMDVTASTRDDDDSYGKLMEMSDLFQERYSLEGMDARIDELEELEAELEAEHEELEEELEAIPKHKRKRGEKLTPDQKKQIAENAERAKELTKQLKAKQAQIDKAEERQKLLAGEKARHQKLAPGIEKTKAKIAELLDEVERIDAEITARALVIAAHDVLSDFAPPPPEGESKKDRAARRAAEKAARQAQARRKKELVALKKKRKAKQAAIGKAQASIDPIHRYADEGFLNLSEPLVESLKTAGLEWGGDWGGSKDFMHFEKKG